jgi:hypothetical protein
MPELEMDPLSNIAREFNEMFGHIDWKDEDKIRQTLELLSLFQWTGDAELDERLLKIAC